MSRLFKMYFVFHTSIQINLEMSVKYWVIYLTVLCEKTDASVSSVLIHLLTSKCSVSFNICQIFHMLPHSEVVCLCPDRNLLLKFKVSADHCLRLQQRQACCPCHPLLTAPCWSSSPQVNMLTLDWFTPDKPNTYLSL